MLLTELVSPPLGAVLMKLVGPHFAFLISVPLEALFFLALSLILEMRSSSTGEDTDEENTKSAPKDKIVRASSRLSQNARHGAGTLALQTGLLVSLLALIVAKNGSPDTRAHPTVHVYQIWMASRKRECLLRYFLLLYLLGR